MTVLIVGHGEVITAMHSGRFTRHRGQQQKPVGREAVTVPTVAVPAVAVPTTVIPTNWRFWRRNGSVINARLGQVQVD